MTAVCIGIWVSWWVWFRVGFWRGFGGERVEGEMGIWNGGLMGYRRSRKDGGLRRRLTAVGFSGGKAE